MEQPRALRAWSVVALPVVAELLLPVFSRVIRRENFDLIRGTGVTSGSLSQFSTRSRQKTEPEKANHRHDAVRNGAYLGSA